MWTTFDLPRLALAAISLGISIELLVAEADTKPEPTPIGVPPEFVDVSQSIPDIIVDLKYHGSENFVGEPIAGYTARRCWMSRSAATQLKKVQARLRPFGLSLKIFDAYRPQSAVNHFVRWAENHESQKRKSQHYPHIDKRNLFSKGYIAKRSGHSRGSSVDLTLASRASGPRETPKELDMGTIFDFFGKSSWTMAPEPTPQQRSNRLLLKTLMEQHGFVNYAKEWWHFRLRDEPFPDTYFDFPTGGVVTAE